MHYTVYTEERGERILVMVADRVPMEDIAKAEGIARNGIWRWQTTVPGWKERLAEARAIAANIDLEESMVDLRVATRPYSSYFYERMGELEAEHNKLHGGRRRTQEEYDAMKAEANAYAGREKRDVNALVARENASRHRAAALHPEVWGERTKVTVDGTIKRAAISDEEAIAEIAVLSQKLGLDYQLVKADELEEDTDDE